MESKGIITVAVTVTVAVIVLAGILMPVLDDATAINETFTNEGYFFMEKIDAEDDTQHTIVWSSSNSKILTVDGVDMDITTWGIDSYQQVTVFATETDMFRLGVQSANDGLAWIQIRGGTIRYAAASTSFNATIGLGSASIQIDSEDSPRSLSYTDAYIISTDSADYVMKNKNESAYMLADSVFYNLGYTSLSYGAGNDGTVFMVTGDMESATVTLISQFTENEITISDVGIVKTAVNGYEDLYLFDKVTFTATENATDNAVVYSYVIVPTQVTAEKSVHLTDSMNGLMAVIPILILVAILIGVAAVVLRNRM